MIQKMNFSDNILASIKFGSFATFDRLLLEGADPNVRDSDGTHLVSLAFQEPHFTNFETFFLSSSASFKSFLPKTWKKIDNSFLNCRKFDKKK